jgi:hypothetical protein
VAAQQSFDIASAQNVPNTQHKRLKRCDNVVLVAGREAGGGRHDIPRRAEASNLREFAVAQVRQQLGEPGAHVVLALNDRRAVGWRITQVDPLVTATTKGFERDVPFGLEEIAYQLLEVLA